MLEQPARQLLQALLPERGADIKGRMRSRQELAEACGLAVESTRFSRLIEVLDRELHILTPTESDSESDTKPHESTDRPANYQLTHDYLVPSLREWLTRDLLVQWMAPKRAFLLAAAGLMSAAQEIGVNPDQRIHDDTRRLTELTGALAIGCFQSTLLLASFIGVLWSLSQGFVLPVGGRSVVIPGFMLWCALIYAASGSWLSDDANTNKYRIVNGTTLGARSSLAFTETQLGFALPSLRTPKTLRTLSKI
jgi:hypothetical protein